MEKITQPAMYFFCREYRTTPPGMLAYVRHIPKELFAAAQQFGLEIAGVMQWHYQGFNPASNEPFNLRIGIPVISPKPVLNPYKCIELPAFECYAALHCGAWSEMLRSYSLIFNKLNDSGIQVSGETREQYLLCNFDREQDNLTYIQVGIK
ncbi:hypothetical protein COR50_07015 [Chitinophaga caeni]|uniref:Bacterial transcription activator effector binding domain-containing protein n=1 Tax=Chitinophaga caeni TaxID=2029983 RepID=A0A291QSV2_9BACT|nr:hypothetical protein [Chitinophaga caeni]ATL46953.1 hypothetical protein COR50_07015 [Chitinophaga caeni]